MSNQFKQLERICAVFIVLCSTAPLTGCDLGDKPIGDGDGGSETDTDDPLICGEITDPAMCNAASNAEIQCSWDLISRAVRTGDVCEITQVGYCFQEELVGETADGCIVGDIPGCPDSNPTYQITPDGVLLGATCGGTPEPGFSACESGLAADATPPECACACELAP